MTLNRRSVLKSLVAGSVLTLPAVSYSKVLGSNEKLRVGVIGLNGRGKDHWAGFGDSVVACCDCDERVLKQVADGKKVETYVDYRKLLDNKTIDAVSIATPNHQHSIMGIRAVMAGKHVYVEKPVSHNVWEGRQLTAAQKKFDRVVQCGTQSRSSPSLKSAVEFVHAGKLGKIQYALGTCYKPRKSIGIRQEPLAIPESTHYDLWCGPAAMKPIFRDHLHYDWHWDFNTGNGDMGNQGIHQMDIARWFLGQNKISPRVLSIGGRVGYTDAGNTPNTQTVIHDYPDAPLIFETRGLPKSKKFQNAPDPKDWDRNMDDYRGSRVGVLVQCEQGYVVIPSYTNATAFDNDGKTIENWDGGGDHYANFVEAALDNDQSKLNGPILEGHLSSALCHTGGISHQLGIPASLKDIDDALTSESETFRSSWKRMRDHLEANEVDLAKHGQLTLGAVLQFDVDQEVVSNNEPANHLMSREYRKGFEVPQIT